MSAPTGSKENWAGNGFFSVKKELKTTAEGARDADQNAGRMWTMVNPNKQHYSSGAPIGYKIMCKDTAPLLPHADSLVGRRATFAKHTIWTTPYVDGQLFPAGKFPTQTRVAPEDSLEFWMKGERNIANTDVVTWLQFGTTHVPRPEDWPVVSVQLSFDKGAATFRLSSSKLMTVFSRQMPYEECKIMFKPSGFFRANPALDVPASADKHSVRALGGGNMPMSEAKSCCGETKL